MKKKNLLLGTMVIVATLIGCNGDDATTVNSYIMPEGYATAWNLVNVSGSIAGTSTDFEPGTIKWIISEDENTVTVINNNTDEMAEDFFDSGVYDYYFTDYDADAPGCPEHFTVNETELGCINTNGEDTMIITQPVADGYTLTFKK